MNKKEKDCDQSWKNRRGRFFTSARMVTNFAGSKIEWSQTSLKGESQDVIRNLRDEPNNLTTVVQFGAYYTYPAINNKCLR